MTYRTGYCIGSRRTVAGCGGDPLATSPRAVDGQTNGAITTVRTIRLVRRQFAGSRNRVPLVHVLAVPRAHAHLQTAHVSRTCRFSPWYIFQTTTPIGLCAKAAVCGGLRASVTQERWGEIGKPCIHRVQVRLWFLVPVLPNCYAKWAPTQLFLLAGGVPTGENRTA